MVEEAVGAAGVTAIAPVRAPCGQRMDAETTELGVAATAPGDKPSGVAKGPMVGDPSRQGATGGRGIEERTTTLNYGTLIPSGARGT